MQGLSLLWLLMAVAIFFFTGSRGTGQYRRQRELARRFSSARPQAQEPDDLSEYRPNSNLSPDAYPSWATPQVGTSADDLDEGISAEMPQEQSVQASPPPKMNGSEFDAGAQELQKAVIWSEILQPPLALRRPRH